MRGLGIRGLASLRFMIENGSYCGHGLAVVMALTMGSGFWIIPGLQGTVSSGPASLGFRGSVPPKRGIDFISY